ncbi:MAG: TolC family protein [Mariprofundaceae bacterium]|nr:TolC family protein [Mariprofundaceae bacterium]
MRFMIFGMVFFAMQTMAWAGELKASLPQAIAWAVEHNPSTEESNAHIRKAAALLSQVRGTRGISGDFVGLISPVPRAKGQPNTPNPGFSSAKLNGITDWETGKLKLILPIFTFGKIKAYEEAAMAGIEVASARKDQAEFGVADLVSQAYQGYLLAVTGKRFANSINKIVDKAMRQVQEKVNRDDDDANPQDLLKLKLAQGLVLKQVYEAEQGEIFARSALNILTGRAMIPQEKSLKRLKLPKWTLSQWVTVARSGRPEFREAIHGVNAMQKLVRVKEAEYFPDIFLIGVLSAAHSSGRDRIIDPFIQDDFNHFYGTVGVGMKWTFDLGGIHHAKVDQAKADLAVVRAKQKYAEMMIPLQVEADYQQLVAKRKQIIALTRSSKAGRQWLFSAASSYDFGVGEAKEVMDALAAYALVEGERLSTVHAYNLQAVNLLHHVGHLQLQELKGEK